MRRRGDLLTMLLQERQDATVRHTCVLQLNPWQQLHLPAQDPAPQPGLPRLRHDAIEDLGHRPRRLCGHVGDLLPG
eukprot:CAMPEP_0115506270 /NCGR_PEP_ID=MMETSP0271-20121206/71058_1 /TAXON_ID=71861 /ORGANISM="Scrippsiella trochoidea, Strain CCMP3099" /LENGTH=75 /DNA_ID=CAMNT_0002935693 /DNA_START=145 /DNA_END=368 /DNA_ORIENTATION=+